MGTGPKPPDPSAGISLGNQVASQQQGYNTTAAEMSQAGSMVNQQNPYGSLSWGQTGTGPNGVPQYTANLKLSPEQQQLFDTLQKTKGTAGAGAANLLESAHYGDKSPTDVIGGMTSGTTKDMLDKEVSYLHPFQQTERDQLDTRLRNQGLFPGQPGYDNAMRSLDTSHSLAVNDFLAKAEPQAFSQATSLYGMPAQMATSLASFGAPGDPSANLVNAPALNLAPPDLTGAVKTETSALQDQYKAQRAQYDAMMNGIFGVGGAVLGGWGKSGGLQKLFG